MQRELSKPVAVLSLAQAVLFITAITMAIFVGVFWPTIVCMLVLGVEAVRARICGRTPRISVIVAWSMTIFIWGALLLQLDKFYALETWHLFLALCLLLGTLLAGKQTEEAPRQLPWHWMAAAWGLMATFTWVAGNYIANRSVEFHLALAISFAVLITARILLPMSGVAIQVLHTVILLMVGLPIADALTRPSYELDTRPETGKPYYSFEAAKKDPVAFSTWWRHFMQQWDHLHEAISIRDTEKVARYRMVPNSQTKIFDSTVKINSLGFRGPEISLEKGDAYRIVALGESTTFGCTITEKGQPWPRLLERKLREGLHPDRPIEVINAGIYGLTIEENIRRLKKRILRLKPDMVISYHGHNYFMSLDAAVPPSQGEPLPEYRPRPLKLLADFEYQLKLRLYERKRTPKPDFNALPTLDPMQTLYAEAYRELIEIARTNNIRLVLANYSMSVNAESDRGVIEFYRAGFPAVRHKIKANALHTEILNNLRKEHPNVIFADTQPILEGRHEKYIDLVHFTQAGREDLAEIMFQTIKDVVARDLASPGKTKPTLITEAKTDFPAG